MEADESTMKRLEGTLHKGHEDHIAGKGINSLNHHNLVHKFIPMPQAMNIPEAKAVVEKEWEKLKTNAALQLTKVRNKNKVIDGARKEGKTVHFASLIDLCHLKNSELEPKHQKYNGRVVLRGDMRAIVIEAYHLAQNDYRQVCFRINKNRNICNLIAGLIF